ncbi:MAG: PilZ domain-containing protein [Candidatus Omnitrophota bacterium]
MRERRTRVELPVSGEVNYRIKDSFKPPVCVLINEISETGLKFISTDIIVKDTILELTIKLADTLEPIPAIGKVIWQRSGASKFLYDTCIKFVSIDSDKERELLRYISQVAKTMMMNRSHVRCTLVTDVIFKILGRPENLNCISGDIGILGMKLLTKEEINVNSTLKLSFVFPDDGERLYFNGRVMWKGRPRDQVYAVGVKFVELDEHCKEKILKYIKSKLLFEDKASE